jgi:hypothetical protein
MKRWQDIAPRDAVGLDLSKRLDITAPLNENGERCPWPWEPQQLVNAPIGQYRCGYCEAMVVAGFEHLDYPPGWDSDENTEHLAAEAERGYEPGQLRPPPATGEGE